MARLALSCWSIPLCLLLALPACGAPQVDSVSLRSEPAELSESELLDALGQKHLTVPAADIAGSLNNQFESALVQDVPVVNDHSTGLMWQGVQSDTRHNWRELEAYVEQVNADGLAGYSDWRVPTAEELASLLTSSQSGDYYISDTFETSGLLSTWTADTIPDQTGGAWMISFTEGRVGQGNRMAGTAHARLVRTM